MSIMGKAKRDAARKLIDAYVPEGELFGHSVALETALEQALNTIDALAEDVLLTMQNAMVDDPGVWGKLNEDLDAYDGPGMDMAVSGDPKP